MAREGGFDLRAERLAVRRPDLEDLTESPLPNLALDLVLAQSASLQHLIQFRLLFAQKTVWL